MKKRMNAEEETKDEEMKKRMKMKIIVGKLYYIRLKYYNHRITRGL
jgi:hypothetical protein